MANNDVRSGDVKQPYQQAPEPVQPLEEKLGQLKVAAQGKLESIAGNANQSLNNAQIAAQNKHDAAKQELSPAGQEQYNSAVQQLGKAYQTAENTGNQVAQQLGLAHNQVRSGVHDLRGVARQEAEQRSHDVEGHVQEGKGALQQGIATVQDALRQGTAVATERLQQGTNTAQQPTASKTSQTNQTNAEEPQSSSLLQSVTAVISQTAVSVKEAFMGKSTTAGGDQSTTVDPASHEAAAAAATGFQATKPVGSSIADAVTAVTNAVKETLAPAATVQQPAKDESVGAPEEQHKTT